MASGNQIKFGVGYEVDKSSVQRVKKSLQDLQNIKLKDFSGTKKDLDQIKQVAGQVENALTKAFSVNLNSLNTQKFNTELKTASLSVDKIYNSFSKAGAQGQVAFSRMASQILTTNIQLKETNNLISRMGETMANTVKWGIASSIMNNFTNSVRSAFQYVKSLDSALTDIRIVTGDSTERMKEFAIQANQAAQTLGRSTMDYSKAALTFYQQGLSDEDVQARTQATLKAQNITGAGDEMADYLTAVWNGYKVANEEAELYVDKLAAVADSSASNMAQLATAMSKVASTANMLGVPVDKLNAQIATITATTRQAPETVGNALKTIYARINDIATGADDAEISLGNYSSKMAEVGFSVLDASGHLRDTGDVIDEIGAKWSTLSREQQIYLARTMAGQRQYNNLLALFENWGRYTDLVTVSMESQGATAEKNSRYMESLSAKMEQLGAAGERVKSAIINEEDLKSLVDFGAGTVNLFGSLIESIGGGRNAILALGSVFTQVFSGTIAKQLNNVITNFQNIHNNTQRINDDIANIKLFGESQGYAKEVITEMVNAKTAASQYYKYMSAAEINQHNQLVKNIAEAKEDLLLTKQRRDAAQAFAKSYTGSKLSKGIGIKGGIFGQEFQQISGTSLLTVQALQEKLNNFTVEKPVQGLKTLESVYSDLFNQIGQKPLELLKGYDQYQNALDAIRDKANPTEMQVNRVKIALKNLLQQAGVKISDAGALGQLNDQLKTTSERLDFAQKKSDQYLNAVKQFANVKTFVNMAAGAGQVASGILSLVNITKIWKNENLSAGEKLLQTFTSLSMALPMLINGYSKVTEGLSKIVEIGRAAVVAKNAEMVANGQVAASNVILEASSVSLSAALKGVAINALTAVASFAPFIAVAAAVGVAIYGLYKWWNRQAEAAKEAAQQMQAVNNIYKDSKDTLEDLKSSLESLKDAQNNLSELTTGTEEWRSALEDVNNQVIELLEKFPQLAQYVSTNANGMLQISEEGQQYVLNQQRQASQANAMGYISSRQRSDAANRQNEITQASRNWGMDVWDASVLDRVITVVQEQGSSILNNTKELQELTGASGKQIEAIDKHKSEIITLAEKLAANTVATDSLTQSIITGTFIDPEKIANSVNSDIFTAQAAKAINNAQLDYSKYGEKIPDAAIAAMGNSGKYDGYYIDPNKIVERYKEINADIADEISISGGKIVRTVKETGEKTQLNLDDIVKAVASADQDIEEIMKQAEETAKSYVEDFGNQAGNIYKLGQGTLATGDISQQDFLNEILGNEEARKRLQDDFGITIQDLADFYFELSQGLSDFIDSLPEKLGEDLKNLADSDKNGLAQLSEATQKIIGTSLKNAWKNGTYDQYLDVLQDIKPEDMEGFTTFVDSLGEEINSIDVTTFKDKLIELGISTTELSNGQIQELINKLREANGINLQEGLGQLYDGATSFLEKYAKDSNATLSKNEFKSLRQIASGLDMDLNQFFEQTWKGTYKLKTTADEFFNYINNQSLSSFKEAITQTLTNIAQLEVAQQQKAGLENSSLGGVKASNWSGDKESIMASINFLQGLGESSETLEEAFIQIRDLGAVNSEYLTQINELLDKHADQWENIPGEIQKANEQVSILKQHEIEAILEQERFRQQYRLMQLDSDVNTDSWKDLTEYLQETADSLNDGIYNGLVEDREAAEDLSEEMLRFASAVEEIQENYDDWNTALTSGSIQEQVQAGNQLQNVYSDILNLPFENLSSDFTQNAENLQYLQTILYGDEQAAQAAYNALALLAQQDIQANVGINDESLAQFDTTLDQIRNIINTGIGDLEVGAYVDDEPAIQAMNNLINAAKMTAQQASDLLASMGVDAQIEEVSVPSKDSEEFVNAITPRRTTETVRVPNIQKTLITGNPEYNTLEIPSFAYDYNSTSQELNKTHTATALRVKSARKTSGGNIGVKRSQAATPKASKSSGGGGGGGKGGGGGSAKQPSIAKLSTESISTKKKDSFVNPYEAVEKSYDRQEDQLKKLDNLQKKLVGKDRLNNLNKQNKELEKQNKIIEQRQKISRDAATEGTTANLRNQISADAVLEQVARFNSDGQLNETASKNAAVNAYNAILNQQKADFDQKVKEYNNWIENVWNKYSGQQQEANKREKELRDGRLKDDKKHAEQAIKIAEEEYNDRIKLIDNYKKALEEDQKYYEQYLENIRKIIENKIAQSKIKVDLSLDFGELERDFLDFRNKVVRKIADDDILGNTKAIRDELKSYYDSKELNNLAERIKSINKEIATIQAGGYSSIYGISRESFDMLKLEDRQALQKEYLKQAKEDLEAYTKQYMKSLEQIQELRDDIYENYLDSIDDVKDKMDQVIDQYDRINDLVQHRIKLTELLYGDNSGFGVLDKYYDKQYKNHLKQLQTLKKQEQYWRDQMHGVDAGSESWKKFKENLENTIDQINAALENQLDLIATKFQNKIQQAIKNITTSLSRGLGNDYLEQEWDYISKDDDAFLDVVNSKFGIDEVERLYTEAMTGTADQQRRINNLMNAQLKILREKDKLTQYDIDRAKAALEVEKARMALEDSRNQKTKMRLRRDSQGNYTYQYVQDEQKLTDLQTALANAQADLYNMDKEHYQQQLNQMYSTYKDYIQKMSQLERQYAATTDAFEKSRLQKQMDLLRDKYSEYFDNINEDLQYNLTQYLPESYADAMGLSLQNYSLPEQVEILKENLPYTNSQMQALSEQIERQGGIVMATKDYYKELTDAAKEAAAAQIEALSVVGSSIEDISSGEDSVGLTETKEYIQYYEDTVSAAKNVTTEVNNLLTSIDKFLGTDFDQNGFIPMLQKSYELLQDINNLEGTNAGKIFNMLTVDQTVDKQVINKNALTDKLQTNFNNASSDYLKNLSSALDMAQAIKLAQDLTESQKAGYLNSLNQYQLGMADDINKMNLINKEALQQSVHIEAMFPNVQNHNEIEEAIEILIGKASQKAAG